MAHLPTFTVVTVTDSLGTDECVVPTCSCHWISGIACATRPQAVAIHDIHARSEKAKSLRAHRRHSRHRAA